MAQFRWRLGLLGLLVGTQSTLTLEEECLCLVAQALHQKGQEGTFLLRLVQQRTRAAGAAGA